MPWTDAQSTEFGLLLLALGDVFNEPVSAQRVELFCRAVEDLPFAAIKDAAARHVRSSKFFPRPAELRELVEGTVEDQAEQAWSHVLREVRRVGYLGTPSFPDPATEQAARALFGGWRALCEHLPAGGPELLGYRKQFIALYGAQARHAERALSHAEAAAALADVTAALRKRKTSG